MFVYHGEAILTADLPPQAKHAHLHGEWLLEAANEHLTLDCERRDGAHRRFRTLLRTFDVAFRYQPHDLTIATTFSCTAAVNAACDAIGENIAEELPPPPDHEERSAQRQQVDGDFSVADEGAAGGGTSAATSSRKQPAEQHQQQAQQQTGQLVPARKEEKGKVGRKADTASADAMREFASVFKESNAEQRQLLRDMAEEQRRREDKRLQHEENLAAKYCRQQ